MYVTVISVIAALLAPLAAPLGAQEGSATDDEFIVDLGTTTFLDVAANDDPGFVPTEVVIRVESLEGSAQPGVDPETGALGIFFTSAPEVFPTSLGATASRQEVGYQLCDATPQCVGAWAYIYQESPTPVLADDTISVPAGTSRLIDVYINDAGFDGYTISPSIVGEPTSGSVEFGSGLVDYPLYRYTADPGDPRSDSFVYEVCNRADVCSTATVFINVSEATPVVADDTIVVAADRPTILADLIFANDPLVDFGARYRPSFLSITTPTSSGEAVATFDTEAGSAVYYTPASRFEGADSLAYQACIPSPSESSESSAELCDIAEVDITVASFGLNDDYAGPIAVGDSAFMSIISNDVGVTGNRRLAVVEPPAAGDVVDIEGNFQYTPYDGTIGIDSFVYEVCLLEDPAMPCDTATVFIEVEPGPVLPDIDADEFGYIADGRFGTFDVLANDSNIDPDTLEIFEGTNSGAERVVDRGDGPVIEAAYAYTGSEPVVRQIWYRVCNSPDPESQQCGLGQLTINLTGTELPVKDTEIANISVLVGETITVEVIDGVDGLVSPFSFEILQIPPHLTASLDESSSPPTAITATGVALGGRDTPIQYHVCNLDETGEPITCNFGNLFIEVVEEPVVAVDDSAMVASGEPTEIDVVGNDQGFDIVGSVVTVDPAPTRGTVTITSDEEGNFSVIYTSEPNRIGNDSFGYEVCDESLVRCDTAVVSVQISPACTIVGTDGPDTLEGTSGDDVICGLGGDDTINARGGNDVVYGGGGNDVITGGSGDDVVYAQGGDDIVYGYAGNDELRGNRGNDEVRGGAGNDDVRGGQGDDDVRGGAGNDSVRGGRGLDEVRGNGGIDYLFGGRDADQLFGGTDGDVIRGNAGSDVIAGGDGPDAVFGGQDDDTINGGGGDDLLRGNGGVDVTDGDGGFDRCNAETEIECEANPNDGGSRSLRLTDDTDFTQWPTVPQLPAIPMDGASTAAGIFCAVALQEVPAGAAGLFDTPAPIHCLSDMADGQFGVISTVDSSAVPVDAVLLTDEFCATTGADLWCIDESSRTYVEVDVAGVTGNILDVAIASADQAAGVPLADATMCVLTDAGVWCAGDNTHGTLGTGDFDPRAGFVEVIGVPTLVDLDMSDRTVCGRDPSGDVWCWGDNRSGQVGNGLVGTGAPTPVAAGLAAMDQVAVGGQTVCALDIEAETVTCWGLYHGNQAESDVMPEPVAVPTVVASPGWQIGELGTELSASSSHMCLLANSQDVYCWGDDTSAQTTGIDPTEDPFVTRPVVLITNAVANNGVDAGEGFTVAWESSGPSYLAGATAP